MRIKFSSELYSLGKSENKVYREEIILNPNLLLLIKLFLNYKKNKIIQC